MHKKIITIVGTRPNFIKITQLQESFKRYSNVFEYKLLHTGQHFDENMSKIFFEQLHISEPDFYLNVDNKGSKMELSTRMETALYDTFKSYKPDLVMVVGDVNSTYAAARAAYLCGIKVAHIESGLRSFDRAMPEEINRLLTDEIADILFVTEESGLINLGREGKSNKHIFFVGNTMIDSLVAFDKNIRESKILDNLGLKRKQFILSTMHRPSNVDTEEGLQNVFEIMSSIVQRFDVVLPIHPRTKKNFEKFDLMNKLKALKGMHLIDPLGYLDFQKLILDALLIVTDSGGIQEEATYQRVPCLTLRKSTERPVTIKLGTNSLVAINPAAVIDAVDEIADGTFRELSSIPPLWDGKSTDRIVDHLYGLSKEGDI